MGVKTDSLAFAAYSRSATATAAATATVSLAYASIVAGHTFAIDDISISWDGAPATAIEATLSDGSTIIDRWKIAQTAGGAITKSYPHARKITPGNDVSFSTSASMATSVNAALVVGYHICGA